MIRLKREIISWEIKSEGGDYFIWIKLQGVWLSFPTGPVRLKPDRVRLVLEIEEPPHEP